MRDGDIVYLTHNFTTSNGVFGALSGEAATVLSPVPNHGKLLVCFQNIHRRFTAWVPCEHLSHYPMEIP